MCLFCVTFENKWDKGHFSGHTQSQLLVVGVALYLLSSQLVLFTSSLLTRGEGGREGGDAGREGWGGGLALRRCLI